MALIELSMKTSPPRCLQLLASLLLLATATPSSAQISTRLTDTIRQGVGSINLLKDVSAAQFAQQVTSTGKLFFGVDVNENAAGNESADSIGVALKGVTLTVTTTTGTYVFTNFSTSTSATLTEAGSKQAASYYTLFGQTGSSQITSSTSGFDLSRFDDVLSISNISFTGDVLSAQMSVTLLNTGTGNDANGTFFDFSGGYEDLAFLSSSDALALESAEIGLSAAPTGIIYSNDAPVVTTTDTVVVSESAKTQEAASSSSSLISPAPAAPAPSLILVLLMVFSVLVLEGVRKTANQKTPRPPYP